MGVVSGEPRGMAMAKYDLTPKMAPYLDRHLVIPLLEFTQERELYPNDQILKTKIELLNNTNMVDYAMNIHKSLYHTDEVPQDMVERRAEVVARLESLEEAAAPLITFLQNPNAFQELRADKQYNLQMLNKRYQIGPEQIKALYKYAKFQFECGNYSEAADYLHHYQALCTNAKRILSALWGKLAAEILMENWDIALEELNRLKEILDSKNFTSSLNQVQSRTRLMHWSLFIFFNHDNGRTQIIDLFNQDKYLNAIQTNAPHLLRYLATALIVDKKRRLELKEFIKVIWREQRSFAADPITEFLVCVFVISDFDGAQKKMKECEDVILNDPFLGKVEESNYTVVPMKDEFLENARLFIFKTYSRIHERIDMGVLADKLNMNYEDAERWILNLIRTSKLDAIIDTQTGTLTMVKNGSAINNNGSGDGTKQNGNYPNQKGPQTEPNLQDNETEQEPKSYASKRAGNILKKSKLHFVAPSVTESGSKRAVIPDDLVLKQADSWSLTLVGYFVGKQPTFLFVKVRANQLWKRFDFEDVVLNDQGYYSLKFMSEQGMQHVLENGPWWFNNNPILLKRWQPGIWFDKPTATVIPLWVNIYDIPIDLWDYEILSHIVSVIGVPIAMDRYTSEICEKKEKKTGKAIFSKVLVEISSEQEVPLFIEADILGTVRKFKLQYDWTPPRCSNCMIFGHKFIDCTERSSAAEEMEVRMDIG